MKMLTAGCYINIFNPYGMCFSPLNRHMGNDGMYGKYGSMALWNTLQRFCSKCKMDASSYDLIDLDRKLKLGLSWFIKIKVLVTLKYMN